MDEQIINMLEIFGRLSTPELASKLRASREAVYGRCKRLEKDGRLRSELRKAGRKGAYFHPMSGLMLTSSTHSEIHHLDEAIGAVIRSYALPVEAAQLVRALEVELERLGTAVPEERQQHFEEFSIELLTAAARAKKRTDVTQFLGIRPMHPDVRIWMLGGQLSLT